jgi:hypothetical protein
MFIPPIFAILFLRKPFGAIAINTSFIFCAPLFSRFISHEIELHFIICQRWCIIARDSLTTRSRVGPLTGLLNAKKIPRKIPKKNPKKNPKENSKKIPRKFQGTFTFTI